MTRGSDRLASEAPVGLAILDADGRLIDLNGAFARALEIDGDDASGHTLEAAGSPFAEAVHDHLERVRASGTRLLGYEIDLPRRDTRLTLDYHPRGGEVWVVVRRRAPDESGGPAERRFRAVLEGSDEMIFGKDLEGRYVFANDACLRVLGRDREEDVLGFRDDELLPPSVAAPLRAHDAGVLRTGRPGRFEETVPGDEGERFFVSSKFPVRDPDGTVVGVCGIARDVTAERHIRRALEESEGRFRMAIHAARSLVFAADLRTDELVVVEGAERLLGLDPVRIRDRPSWWARVHPDDRAGLLEAIRRAQESGNEFEASYRVRHADGRWIDVEQHTGVVRDDHGTPVQHVGVILDITERRRYEAERERLIAELEHANRVKSDFMGTISHELRTPLNAVLGYTALMEDGLAGELGEEARGYVQRIRMSARHQQQLIEEILTFSRLEAGRESVTWDDVEIEDLLEEVRAIVQPLAGEKGLDFEVVDRHDGPVLRTDPRKLRQMLVNLLGNAVKFTEEGWVRLTVRGDADGATFEVADTGAGIAADAMDRIFDPFFQSTPGEGVKPREGTGLGLAVTRRFARMMGGDVEVRSAPEEGSVFTIRLPAPTEEDEAGGVEGGPGGGGG